MYYCKTETCAIAISKAAFPAEMNCPVCKEPLEKENETALSEQEQMIVDNYPYVMAFPFERMLNEKDSQRKINLLVDTFQNTLKYLALVLATEYFESDLKNVAINTLFKEKLFRYSLGDLNHFIRETLKELNNEEHIFFVQELPEFYKIITKAKSKYKTIKKITNDLGKEVEKKADKLDAISALLSFRNKEVGHGGTKSLQKYTELYESYYPILLDVLSAMNFVVRYPMYKWDKGGKYELMGTKISLFEQDENNIQDHRMWLEGKAQEKLFLAPFFILPKLYFAGVDDTVEVFIYEENAGSRLIYLSPEENEKKETSGEVVQQLQQLLHNKQVSRKYTKDQLTTEILDTQVSNYNQTVFKELTKECKLIPGIYQERQEAEIALRSWVGSRFGLYVLSAAAGSGKTNLLAEMQRQYTTREVSCLFLRASRLGNITIEEELKKVLDLHPNYDFNTLKDIGYTQENPFVILIDGGNEQNTPDAFMLDVLSFLEKHAGGFIKIVLSWRADLKRELPVVDAKFENLIYSDKEDTSETHILAKKASNLVPLDKKELEEAWRVYTKHNSKSYRPKFSLADLTYFDRKLTDELHNPLHLKLFLELFNNKGLPKTKGFFNLWDAYSKVLKQNGEEYKLLLLLVELMFEKALHSLPSAIVYEHPEISVYLHNKDITAAYEQLKRKGVLAEYYKDDERYITFAVEAFYHYSLGEFIHNKYTALPNEALLELLKTHPLKGIQNGIQQSLLLDIDKQDFSRLIWLIDNSEEALLSWYAFPLAQAFIKNDVESVFEKLFEKPTGNDFFVLYKSLNIINIADENSLLKKIYKYANLLIQPKCLYSFLVKIESIKNLVSNDCNLDERIAIIKIDSSQKGNELTNYDAEMVDYVLGGLYDEDNEDNDNEEQLNSQRLTVSELLFEKESQLGEIDSLLKNMIFNDIEKSTIYDLLSSSYKQLNNRNKALDYLNKSLQLKKSFYSDHHPSLWKTYNDIGMFYHEILDFDMSFKFYKKALGVITEESQISLAHIYNNLGSLYTDTGDISLGIEFIEKSLKINQKILGKEHEFVATCYNNMGLNFDEQKKYDEALVYYNKSLQLLIKLFKADENINIATLYDHIGVINIRLENYEKGFVLLNKGLSIRIKILGYGHPDVAFSYRNLGSAYNTIGEFEKAMQFYNDCVMLLVPLSKDPDNILFTSRNQYQIYLSYKDIGNVQKRLEKYGEAVKSYEKALKLLYKIPDSNMEIVNMYDSIGICNILQGDFENIFDFYNKRAGLLLKRNNIKELVSIIRGRFIVLNQSDKSLCWLEKNEALHWLEQAVIVITEDLGKENKTTQNTITELITYTKEVGELELAEKWEKEIIKQ